MTSCYGLLDEQMILSPVLTGKWVELDNYPGCRYVAFKTKETQKVDIYFFD
jgi:hypothetical protein